MSLDNEQSYWNCSRMWWHLVGFRLFPIARLSFAISEQLKLHLVPAIQLANINFSQLRLICDWSKTRLRGRKSEPFLHWLESWKAIVVQVYSGWGISDKDPVLFSGNLATPFGYSTTTTNKLTVRFISDPTTALAGFKAYFFWNAFQHFYKLAAYEKIVK